MIAHDVEQGSADWLQLRAGVPTASAFGNLVTPEFKARTGEMPRTYVARLAGERLLGMPFDDFADAVTDRGKMLEEDAIPWYEYTRDVDVQRVGFVTTDDGELGCSPDGLVGDDGMVEVKAPLALSKSAEYIKALLADEARAVKEYIVQVAGELLVCERQWCDLVLYHPDLPRRVIRVDRSGALLGAERMAVVNAQARACAARVAVAVEQLRALR